MRYVLYYELTCFIQIIYKLILHVLFYTKFQVINCMTHKGFEYFIVICNSLPCLKKSLVNTYESTSYKKSNNNGYFFVLQKLRS